MPLIRVEIHKSLMPDLNVLALFLQGIENIRNEIQDTMEPLIDPVHGHGRYKKKSYNTTRLFLPQQSVLCTLYCVDSWTLQLSLVFSQSLVNLLVTGHAVSNVWDGDRECSGMSKSCMMLLHTHRNSVIHTSDACTQPCCMALDLHHIHQRELWCFYVTAVHKQHR